MPLPLAFRLAPAAASVRVAKNPDDYIALVNAGVNGSKRQRDT